MQSDKYLQQIEQCLHSGQYYHNFSCLILRNARKFTISIKKLNKKYTIYNIFLYFECIYLILDE